ncbi:MAG: hypothetical protein ACR2I5_09210 [Candidatus Limnocylindria bacterium]
MRAEWPARSGHSTLLVHPGNEQSPLKGATAMTDRQTVIQDNLPAREAVVWIDHARAIIFEFGARDHRVQVVDRLLAEQEERFEARAIDKVLDRDRVIVSGPAYARIGFERAYVALTHRPDRLVDAQRTISDGV